MTHREETECLIIEHHENHAVVTLNRPQSRNAFDDAMIDEFAASMKNLAAADPGILILTGTDCNTFCAGYDIDCIDPNQSPDDPLPDDRFEPVIRAVENFPSPVIAAVNGHAYGGGLDLALACDFRIARRGIKVAMTPCRLGLVYSPSGTARFIRKLGSQTARIVLLTCSRIDDSEALRLRIMDELVDDEMARARELAKTIAGNAPIAVRGTRKTIQMIENALPVEGALLEEIQVLRKMALESEDLREGVAAFHERRRPVFKGK